MDVTDKFRIAMVAACPFPYPRGTPVRIYRMAEILSGSGHEVHVITYHLGQKEADAPFMVHRIPNLNFYKKMSPGPSILKLLVLDQLLALEMLRLCRKYKFDIIHAHHVEGFLAAQPVRLFWNIPIIFDMHTLLSTELQYYELHLQVQRLKRIGRFFDEHLPKYADHVIGVTDEIKTHLLSNHTLPPERISVVPNGIELGHFSDVAVTRKPHEKNTILGFAGNAAPYQGVEIMMEALSLLLKSDPHVCLHLYSNDSFDQYQPLIEKSHLRSYIKVFRTDFGQLPDQLAGSDILLNPRPDGAGLPLKLLNYMAAGKPVVSFAASGHGLTHGKNAWLIKGNDPQKFADGIRCLMENRAVAAELGRNAQKFVEQHFSWKSRGEDIVKIYQGLLKKG